MLAHKSVCEIVSTLLTQADIKLAGVLEDAQLASHTSKARIVRVLLDIFNDYASIAHHLSQAIAATSWLATAISHTHKLCATLHMSQCTRMVTKLQFTR